MAKFQIRELMKEAKQRHREGIGEKVTQEILAKAANTSQSYISEIINNKASHPDPNVLIAIADRLSKALGRPLAVNDLIHNPDPNVEWTNLPEFNKDNCVLMPILGDIPCGELRLVTDEQIIGWEYMPIHEAQKGYFWLRAKGDSMEPYIMEGDLLLVDSKGKTQWNNRDIIIAYVDGEVTCKQIELKNNHALLRPFNPRHPTIIITDQMEITGRVVEIKRKTVNGWIP